MNPLGNTALTHNYTENSHQAFTRVCVVSGFSLYAFSKGHCEPFRATDVPLRPAPKPNIHLNYLNFKKKKNCLGSEYRA